MRRNIRLGFRRGLGWSGVRVGGRSVKSDLMEGLGWNGPLRWKEIEGK